MCHPLPTGLRRRFLPLVPLPGSHLPSGKRPPRSHCRGSPSIPPTLDVMPPCEYVASFCEKLNHGAPTHIHGTVFLKIVTEKEGVSPLPALSVLLGP